MSGQDCGLVGHGKDQRLQVIMWSCTWHAKEGMCKARCDTIELWGEERERERPTPGRQPARDCRMGGVASKGVPHGRGCQQGAAAWAGLPERGCRMGGTARKGVPHGRGCQQGDCQCRRSGDPKLEGRREGRARGRTHLQNAQSCGGSRSRCGL
eukprot:352153-Chlamydomonas_euryale.AAC.4